MMGEAVGAEVRRPRWKATIEYRSENGILDVFHCFEEIEELHDLIERGPHWDTIIKCTVEHFDPPSDLVVPLTIERAEKM